MSGRGIGRIVIGVIFLLIGFSLFAVPFGYVGGVFLVIIGLLLIMWGFFTERRMKRVAQPTVFSPSAVGATTPSTCKACGTTNMLGATRCSKCGSPL